jgi:hypothetical protein
MISIAIAKAEERQNRQNDDDQADQIDKTVHGYPPPNVPPPCLDRQFFATGKVPPANRKKMQSKRLTFRFKPLAPRLFCEDPIPISSALPHRQGP